MKERDFFKFFNDVPPYEKKGEKKFWVFPKKKQVSYSKKNSKNYGEIFFLIISAKKSYLWKNRFFFDKKYFLNDCS